VLSLKEPLFQIRGLVHLARLRATRGDKEAAGQLLDEAEGLASRLLRDNWQAWSLAEIAAALQEIGQDRRAEEVARSVHGESERVSLFDVFSLAFVLSGGLAGWALFHYKEPGRLVTQAMAAGTAVVLALQLAFLIVSTPALAPRTDLQMNLLCVIEIWLVFTVIVLRTPSIKGTMVPAVPASR
jgi:ATP/maltotriose-dependent transcriptional regulator MalT